MKHLHWIMIGVLAMGIVGAVSGETVFSDNFEEGLGADDSILNHNGANMAPGRQSGLLAPVDWATATKADSAWAISPDGAISSSGGNNSFTYIDNDLTAGLRGVTNLTLSFDFKPDDTVNAWYNLAFGIPEANLNSGTYHYTSAGNNPAGGRTRATSGLWRRRPLQEGYCAFLRTARRHRGPVSITWASSGAP
jgi:hypothetical protein